MIKVSIIVPVYNVQDYLEKCLDSLVNQTLKEIEIIIVNDGSTDCSQEIIDDFALRFPEKIRSYRKKNGGLSDARNYGLEKASGQFIGFVDSDDYVSPQMYEEMFALAIKQGAQMVVCNLQKVNENGRVTQQLVQIPNMQEKIELNKHLSVFSDLSYFACNKLFKSNLFKEKRFKVGVHFEDIQLIPQLLLNCEVIAQTQNYHYQYLERSDSITKTHTERGLDILSAVQDVEVVFAQSRFSAQHQALKDFLILEGVYTFLAYMAKVKDETLFDKMALELEINRLQWKISTLDLLKYKRFDKNYILYLPLKKKLFYLMYFFGLKKLIKKIL